MQDAAHSATHSGGLAASHSGIRQPVNCRQGRVCSDQHCPADPWNNSVATLAQCCVVDESFPVRTASFRTFASACASERMRLLAETDRWSCTCFSARQICVNQSSTWGHPLPQPSRIIQHRHQRDADYSHAPFFEHAHCTPAPRGLDALFEPARQLPIVARNAMHSHKGVSKLRGWAYV